MAKYFIALPHRVVSSILTLYFSKPPFRRHCRSETA